MGRKGYKGIAAVAEDLYVINDDGDHVIRMCEVRPGAVECKVMIIAGQPGLNGNVDHEHGCSALLSRPGRIQADLVNKKCYFGSRTFKNIRVLSLESTFPVSTLPVDFQTILPAADLDFNRILVTPSGHKMLLADRKGPYIVLVSNVLSASPSLSLLHTPGCGLKKPLQGACFPIVPLHLDNPNSVWDATAESRVEQRMTRHLDESSGNVTNDLDRLLPVCVDQCLVAAGSRIWLIPTHENKALSPLPAHLLPQSAGDDLALDFLPPSAPVLQMTDSMVSQTSEQNEDEEEADDDDDKGDKAKPAPYPPEFQPYYDSVNAMRSQCTLLCNVSSEFPKFLIHDMVALTSNTILVLNRNSRRTGVWQFTTKDSWGYEKGTEVRKHFGLRYLAGKDYLGPHGMVLSLDRKHLLVVETGLRGESQRGGYINLLSLHFYEEQEKRQGRGQVRVGYSRKLSEVPMSIEHWEERVILASEGIAQALRSHGGMAYERLYAMDGERFEDRGDEGLEMHDYMKPTVKGIEKFFGSLRR